MPMECIRPPWSWRSDLHDVAATDRRRAAIVVSSFLSHVVSSFSSCGSTSSFFSRGSASLSFSRGSWIDTEACRAPGFREGGMIEGLI